MFFIILLLRPFELNRVATPYFPLHAALYGLGTFVTAALNSLLLPSILPSWFAEKHWTVGKELLMMLWQIVAISFVNLLITHGLYGDPISLLTAIDFLGYTLAIGIFPVIIVVLLKYVILLSKNQAAAGKMEQELGEKQEEAEPASKVITLIGDYQNEVLEVPLDSIRYITSADNYVQVYYVENGKLTSRFLRSTLKKAEQALSGFPQFFRCHRAYLVNLTKVRHVTGNAQGLKLHLQDAEEVIPVSRSLHEQLTSQLQQQKRVAN
ncbi:LytTR family DNA-binding domain-containing protein [Telluribacter sp. SYSU D00476]|uniref:LytR/AlgR family response regulator transcription factor n=1 Tax=Telluribacter sp. SYSU D00476 TaxID=2811430 RepID=UPI001FF24293|nr:LytTR family DNA-binding domain-containing protein [Telluribacter sp. SYSU D00476]